MAAYHPPVPLHRLIFLLVTLLSTTFDAQASNLIEITGWDTPGGDATSLPPRGAVVGDAVRFTWIFGALHNVYIHPDFNCDLEGRIDVGEESGVIYNFTEADVGETFFVCDAFNHCNRGLTVTFTVVETQEKLDELEESGYFEQTSGASFTGFGLVLAAAVTAVSVLTSLLNG